MLADLHMHSTVSDGWRDPDEVAHLAADRGVRVMALSDHDTFGGVERARTVAHRRGLGYLPAVEVTTYPPNQMRHILGHGVDLGHPGLNALLARTRSVVRRQAEVWIASLDEEGIGRELGFRAFRFKPNLMPGAILKVILQHRLMTEREGWDSFRKAIAVLPADLEATIPTPAEAIDAIHAAGGLAVHAHPGVVPDQDLMKEVLPLVDGLEVYTRRHNADQVAQYEELARLRGLWMTVGTDYHGFYGDDYAAPRTVVDARYLETLGSRIEWPAVAQAV